MNILALLHSLLFQWMVLFIDFGTYMHNPNIVYFWVYFVNVLLAHDNPSCFLMNLGFGSPNLSLIGLDTIIKGDILMQSGANIKLSRD